MNREAVGECTAIFGAKEIEKENRNYSDNNDNTEVSIQHFPGSANITSSHHIFQMKYNVESEKLRFKCRLVPHVNRNLKTDDGRNELFTVQHPVIRAILSACVILGLSLDNIEIYGAFLQPKPFDRDVNARFPKNWTISKFTVWKLLKIAYDFAD